MDGLAASLAAIAFGFFAIDAVTIHPNDTDARPRARRRCAPASASCRSTSAREAARSSSWATPARRCSASRSPRSGSPRAGTSPARRSRRCCCPILDPRRPDPGHDARHDRPPARGTSDLAGRTRPLARTGSFASACRRSTRWRCSRCLATALGATSLAYNVLDRPARLHVLGVLVTFVLLVQFASFLADVERGRPTRGAPARARPSPCTGGASSRCSSTSS